MRVLNFIMSERPSTTNAIRKRKAIRLNFTQTQINVYKTKTTFTDLLFLSLEKSFLQENFYDLPDINSQIDDAVFVMYQYLPNFSIIQHLKTICI